MKKQSRVTVTPVTGTHRHVSKTHGTHNGRSYSFPHLSDKLDRPKPLPDLSPSTVRDRKLGKRHRRVRMPQIRIVPCLYQDPAKDIPSSLIKFCASYAFVCAFADEEVAGTMQLLARDEDEAARLARAYIKASFLPVPWHPTHVSVELASR